MSKITTTSPLSVTFPDYGVRVLESHHHRRFTMPEVEWNYTIVMHVLAGKGELKSRRRTHILETDTIVFIPEHTAYRLVDHPDHSLSLYLLCLEHSIYQASDFPRTLSVRPRDENAMAYRQAFRDLLHAQHEGGSAAARRIHEKVFALMNVFLDGATSHEQTTSSVERMVRYVGELDKRFFHDLDLEAEAMSIQLSRRRFTQLFRDITGESWLKVVRRKRFEHAMGLLKTTDKSARAIAFESGFNDLANFYRGFKDKTGKTPDEFRLSKRR